MKNRLNLIILPAAKGGFNPDQELPIQLTMSLTFARLLRDILVFYTSAALIRDCLKRAIRQAEKHKNKSLIDSTD